MDLLTVPLPVDAAAAIDELDELERLKGAIAARQARVVGALIADSPGATVRSLGGQVGMARHESPHKGRQLLLLGRALTSDHPEVLALLEAGEINERRAEAICHATRDLTPIERRLADSQIADQLLAQPGLGDKDVVDLACRTTLRINSAAAERRRKRAIADRHVNHRSHGDGTATVSARLEDWLASAVMKSLEQGADIEVGQRNAEILAGEQEPDADTRSRAQVIADLFVKRLLGKVEALPVHLDLVMAVETLLGDSDEPGDLPGYGPIPGDIARKLVLASPEGRTLVRRLFADTDHLVAMESHAEYFDGLLRELITIRDRRCRTPWCNAPIRHLNHVRRRADCGESSFHNGEGLCEDCNYTAEEPGWSREVVSDDVIAPHEVEVTTPTGHRHRSRAPAPPRPSHYDLNPGDYPPGLTLVETRPGYFTLIA